MQNPVMDLGRRRIGIESYYRIPVPKINHYDSSSIPIGFARQVHVAEDSNEWMSSNGRTVMISEYPELYAVLGRLYTSSETWNDRFSLPDFGYPAVIKVK